MSEELFPFEHAVLAERERQEARWGHQRHSWPGWMTILTEEVGEVARAMLNAFDAPGCVGAIHLESRMRDIRRELIQAAAVIRAMVEHIDEAIYLPAGQATCFPPSFGEALHWGPFVITKADREAS